MELSPNTKCAKHFLRMYEHATDLTINELYKKPSTVKQDIFARLYNNVPDGCKHTIKVWGNSMLFSFGYTDAAGVHIITRNKHYLIRQNENESMQK